MKKLFLTLLCFALLLSACGPAIVPSGTDASTETGTAAVTGPGETTEALPPETIEPLPPETTEALPTEPPVQFEGSATAGGIRVYKSLYSRPRASRWALMASLSSRAPWSHASAII